MAKNNVLSFGGSGNSNWKKGAATVKFSKDEKRVKFVFEKEAVTCSASLLPDIPESINEDDEYFVELRLDEDGDVQEVASVRPTQWMGLKMKCVDMTRPEKDADPAPVEITKTFSGKEVTYSAFNVFLEVLEGEYKGARWPYWLHYKFESDGEGGTRWAGNYDNPKATRLHQAVDFFTLMGAVEEPINWPDDGNVLPELLARILDKGVVVETAGKDGYITAMNEAREQPVKASKPAKKQVRKDEDFDDYELLF